MRQYKEQRKHSKPKCQSRYGYGCLPHIQVTVSWWYCCFFFLIKSSHILVKLKFYFNLKIWTLCNLADVGQESVSGVDAVECKWTLQSLIQKPLLFTLSWMTQKKYLNPFINRKYMSLNCAENRGKIQSRVNFEPHDQKWLLEDVRNRSQISQGNSVWNKFSQHNSRKIIPHQQGVGLAQISFACTDHWC